MAKQDRCGSMFGGREREIPVFGKKDAPNFDKVDTILGKDCRFKGTLNSNGSVRIEGQFEGEILHEGDLVIGEKARVVADIKARHLLIAGEVRGNVEAEGKLELLPTAQLYGDIKVGNLVVADGAIFQGTSEMAGKDEGQPQEGPQDETA